MLKARQSGPHWVNVFKIESSAFEESMKTPWWVIEQWLEYDGIHTSIRSKTLAKYDNSAEAHAMCKHWRDDND